jgi:hypothetical protein
MQKITHSLSKTFPFKQSPASSLPTISLIQGSLAVGRERKLWRKLRDWNGKEWILKTPTNFITN